MGVLGDIDKRFGELVESPELETAFAAWRSRRPALSQLEGPAEMLAYLREQRGEYEDRDRIVWALCLEAGAEARAARRVPARPRPASDLLLGLFAPGLWRVFEEVRSAGVLHAHEIQAELVLGFWEAFTRKRDHKKVSGELVNSARHRAWAAALQEGRAALPDETAPQAPHSADADGPDWSDPWLLLCWAEVEGALNKVQTELIFWTRLQGDSLRKVAEALGLGYDAAKLRRNRGENRLRSWLEANRHRYPPSDPDVGARVVTRAFTRAHPRTARVPPAHFSAADPDTDRPQILFEQMRGRDPG